MISENMGMEKMREKEKRLVEGEKKGEREVEIEEMCEVSGVSGERIVCGVELEQEEELMKMVRWIEEERMKREDEEGEERGKGEEGEKGEGRDDEEGER